jgi:hypothetical protein
MATATQHRVGDTVTVDDPKFPGLWTVKSIGPVNTTLTPVGGGRGLRAPHYMVMPSDGKATITEVPVVTVQWYCIGEIVRLEHGKHTGLFVVIADKGDKVNLARLGGDNDRYLRMPKSARLIKVDPSEVLK